MGDNYLIKTQGLTKKYGSQVAVDRLDLVVKEGEIFGFLGPNGAGKTTTILMLMGLTPPSSGECEVCGLNPMEKPIEVKKLIGYLPENVGFYPDMNAIESLLFIAELNQIPYEIAIERADDLLELVGLSKDRYKKIGAYSRGMRQRLGIAEVLIKDPKILFLDEPTLGLDPDAADKLINLIQELNREKDISVLVSSHNLGQVQKISHRVGIMLQGKMVAQGSLEELSKEKFGVGDRLYSLEEIYLKYFRGE